MALHFSARNSRLASDNKTLIHAHKNSTLTRLFFFFFFCFSPLKKSSELKDYLDAIYTEAAQFDYPPTYRVSLVCDGVDGAPNGTDILGRIFAGVAAYLGEKSCYDLNIFNDLTDETSLAWAWQVN